MIGIIDSGIGGKGIEKEIRRLLPKAKISYFRDQKNFPYGTKSVSRVNQILAKNCEAMIKRKAQMIVIACNSGSVSSLKYLREKFDIPIVGVVPAVKTAAEMTKNKRIAIFATPITCKSQMLKELCQNYCQGIKVYKIAFKDLASQIERGKTNSATYEVAAVWQKYQDRNIDVIVLGCTHYVLIKDEIQKIVGQDIKIIDSNKAVARQVKIIYDEINVKQ